jgi:hypothetical protein
MDARCDVPSGAPTIETVHIDRLADPFRWVKWTNVGLLTLAVVTPFEMVSSALKGQFHVSTIVVSLILIFPGWIAWKNVNVVNSLNQRYTIRSFLLVGVPAFAIGLVSLAALIGGLVKPANNLAEDTLSIGFFLVVGSIALLATLSVWRLRRCVIDPLDVKLTDLRSALSQQRAPSKLRNVGPQRPLRGWTLIAIAVMVLVVHGFLPAGAPGEITGYVARFGFFLILMARSAFQPSATMVLKADNRKPVLLLRSFIDDERLNWQRSESSFVDSSLESRLTNHFADYGPFIAVGAPYEDMPVIGAARIKLTNAEWRDQVVSWIDGSAIILMMAGITDWIDWELKQVIAYNALERLIICFPPISLKWYRLALGRDAK